MVWWRPTGTAAPAFGYLASVALAAAIMASTCSDWIPRPSEKPRSTLMTSGAYLPHVVATQVEEE